MNTHSLILIIGVAVITFATLASFSRSLVKIGVLMQATGAALVAVAGFLLSSAGATIGSGFTNGIAPALGVDPLSGFFLGVVGLTASAAFVYSHSYLREEDHPAGVAVAGGAFALSMIGVLVARDAFTFLLFWELMTLAPAISIVLHSQSDSSLRSVLNYLAITHVASAATWIVLIALAHQESLSETSAHAASSGWTQSLLAIGALIGFGTKAGLAPLHSWLPRAHPAAPGNMSAMMSGVMIKVAIYGLIRAMFDWIDPLPAWVAPSLLVIACVSCLAGVTYALMQHELKRVLAFSSVENIGIITLGLSTALLAAQHEHPLVATIAFTGSMLHVLNHALFKSLLFLCAGSFQRRVGELEIDRMGGLLRSMPATGVAFIVGSMAIAGVPPFNGFVSEWLTLQGMLQLAMTGNGGSVLWGTLGVTALATTAALAVFCFVKIVGLVLLGKNRGSRLPESAEVSRWMTVPQTTLAVSCIALGVVPGLAINLVQTTSPFDTAEIASETYGINLTLAGGFRPLFVALLFMGLVIALQFLRSRAKTSDMSPTWNCGQVDHRRLSWTSTGFTESLRMALAVVLRPRRDINVVKANGRVAQLTHQSEVPHIFDEWLYKPVVAAATATGRAMLRIQSGSLRVYLAYLTATIIATLAFVRVVVSW